MKHRLRSLDPFLSFAYSSGDLPESSSESIIPGFKVLSSPDETPENLLKVVTLGGSTTSQYFLENWPKHFKSLLDDKQKPSILYNGGVNGYSSNQELLKLIRDVLPLKPDIVISLTGINDIGFMHSIKKHPMIHPYSNYVLQTVLSKRIRSKQKQDVINDINYGPVVDTTPAEQWKKNLRLMSAITREYGVRFYAFLQPTMGVGKYTPSEHENEMLDAYNEARGGVYIKETLAFYEDAIKTCDKYDNVINLVDILKDSRDLYYNPRHQNAEGYKLIANAIFTHLVDAKAI